MLRTTLALIALLAVGACSDPTAPSFTPEMDPSSYAVAHDEATRPAGVSFSGYSVSSGSVNVPTPDFAHYNCAQC